MRRLAGAGLELFCFLVCLAVAVYINTGRP